MIKILKAKYGNYLKFDGQRLLWVMVYNRGL